MADLRTVPITSIRQNTVALRGVDAESPKFRELIESIAHNGIINAIAVREQTDPTNGEKYLEVIDGLHRFKASIEAGLQEVPVNVLTISEAENLDIQISANLHKIDTRPMEYTRALLQILAANPTMTVPQLAGKINASVTFIEQRLSLMKLHDDIKELVNTGKICLANGFSISKLPRDEQADWIQRGMTVNANEFVPACQARVREINAAEKKGKDPKKLEFSAHPFLQTVKTIVGEHDNPTAVLNLIQKNGVTDPLEAAVMALAWVLNLDPDSVAVQKEKWDRAQAAKDEAKKKRAEEAAAKKAEAEKAAAEKEVDLKESLLKA